MLSLEPTQFRILSLFGKAIILLYSECICALACGHTPIDSTHSFLTWDSSRNYKTHSTLSVVEVGLAAIPAGMG